VVCEGFDDRLMGNVEDLTSDLLQPLVVNLRRARRAANGNLCELLWYYMYTPLLRACSVDFLMPLLGKKKAFYGFRIPL
jgi:hypothetical protein